MNALDRVLGRKVEETTTTGDIAPVMANVPTWQHLRRKKENEKKKKSCDVACVIGESSDDENVFPKDAEEADEGDFYAAQGVHVPKPKEAAVKPDEPSSDEERLLTPAAALVAPDVTPDSMTEIDPSKVPGQSNGKSFRAGDLAPKPQDSGETDRTDAAVSQMDILLGRPRSSPNGPGTPPPPQPTMTEDSAAALFNQKSAEELMAAGVPQPPPPGRVDARSVCEAARKFI